MAFSVLGQFLLKPLAQTVPDPGYPGYLGFFTARSHYLYASHTPDPKSV